MMKPVYESMSMLYSKAKDNLTMEELSSLSDLADEVSSEAMRLSRMTETLGCLVNYDANNKDRHGGFQHGDDVFNLMCCLSHSLDTLGGMAEVAAMAAYEHRTRSAKA